MSNLTAVVDLLLGDIDFRPPVDSTGVWIGVVRSEVGFASFSGNGNSGPLLFFRLLSLKNVVVVEMVCVVVVLAYTWWSPELSSDREDSDSLDTGIAREEDVSSP